MVVLNFREIEFKLKFGCSPPTLLDQGVRLEFRTSFNNLHNSNWSPIKYYATSTDTPTGNNIVNLEPSGDLVMAEGSLYPLQIINPSQPVLIREYICVSPVQTFTEGIQLELRWMQFSGMEFKNKKEDWILDDINIRIWNGICFLQVLSEDFNGDKMTIEDVYDIVKGKIESPSCESPGSEKAAYFREKTKTNEDIRSINIPVYLDENISCEEIMSAESKWKVFIAFFGCNHCDQLCNLFIDAFDQVSEVI